MSTQTSPDLALYRTIGQIAAVLGSDRLPTGERAALRRMHPSQSVPLVFHRFSLRYLPADWDQTVEARKDWVTLVAGIALMSPNAHRPDLGLGKALAQTGYSEARLERLLAAEGDTRRALLLRAARFLAAHATACNWVEGALLLLTRDPDKREAIHYRIAREFYRSLE